MEVVGSFFYHFLMGFVNLVLLPWHIYQWLTLETLKLKMNALLLAGASVELFFMLIAVICILVGGGIYNRNFLRRTTLLLEQFNGRAGQLAAWFALLMMIQQVLIIVMGQVFRGNEIHFAPLGLSLFDEELQWLSGQLKFYNAVLIAVASAYTFIEGGHVRVDLVYASVSRIRKRWIDLFGTVFFLFPSAVLLWWFSWPIAMNSIFAQRPMNLWSTKASWRNVRLETSGTAEFSWVWSFKCLILVFAALLIVVAISFLLRNLLAILEPKEQIEPHYSFEQSSDYGGLLKSEKSQG